VGVWRGFEATWVPARGRVLVTLCAVAGVAVPVAADPPQEAAEPVIADWWGDLSAEPGALAQAPTAEPAESAPLIRDTPLEAEALPAVELPVPAVAEVTLAERGEARQVGETPVSLAAGARPAVGDAVRVEVLDGAAAVRAGVPGPLFRLSGADGARLDDRTVQPVTVAVDYSGFVGQFGAGYGDRLAAVVLPVCAVADPVPAGCDRSGTVLESRNELAGDRLVVDVADLAGLQTEATAAPVGAGTEAAVPDAGAGVVLALLAGPEGEGGSFEATPLSVSGDWEVGLGSGEFSWNYDVPLPAAPGGPTPEVNLAYSSGAVDGMVSSKNTQAGPSGLGWSDFADSFIERRYNSCLDDGQTHADLCWVGFNASISLNGQASELVPEPGQPAGDPVRWRLKSDPRWRVERLKLADPSSPTEQNGDADGEYWKVTTPDGTQYWFGLGYNPGGGWLTDSTWTVPVFGDDVGEPCHTASTTDLNWCSQAWRWNLDRVVDPKGNSQTFRYESEPNHYRGYDGSLPYAATPYERSGRLIDIYYGKRADESENFAANVHFESKWRCSTLDAPGTNPCIEPHNDPSQVFPDTPLDLICGEGTAACPVAHRSPTFFTTQRYKSVSVCVSGGPAGVCDLTDRIEFTHTFTDDNDPATDEDKKLFLTGIQRTGNDTHDDPDTETNTTLTLPPTTFGHVLLENRHLPATGESKMPHWRVGKVTDEFGREVNVTYGQPHPCPPSLPDPPQWDQNTKNCFPQMWGPEGETPTFRAFNKYLVTKIEVKALNGNTPDGSSPPVVTEYFYGDKINTAAAAPTTWSTPRDQPEAAWHKDQDPYAPQATLSWTEWRGYQDVLVKQGDTRTRYKLYRGMHGDEFQNPAPGGTRNVTLTSLDGTVTNAQDSNWLAGRVFDEMALRADGTPEHGTLHAYTSTITANVPCTGVGCNDSADLLDARWVAENETIVRRRTPAAGTVFRRQRTQTTYNGLLLFPEDVIEHGWTDATGDDRCTRTAYAFNVTPSAYLIDYPQSVTQYGTTTCSGTEVTRSETAYDDGAVGAAPTLGNPTMSRVKLTSTPTTTWATTTAAFDVLGRAREVTGPNGHTTFTDYGGPWTDAGYPFEIRVTNEAGHEQYTLLRLVRQIPKEIHDPNQKITRYTYDPLGRVTEAHRPSEDPENPDPAAWKFTYDIDPERDEMPVIQTDQLQDELGPAGAPRYLTTWTLYDSMLRERQTHTLSPETGKVIVADTTYDTQGRVSTTNVPEAVTAPAGNALAGVPTHGWRNFSQTFYDTIGRPTWELFWADADSGNTADDFQRSTVTAYTHETIEVDPYVGGNTRTKTDGLGRSIEVAEHDGTAYRATTYGYDKADRLTSVTDPANNTIAYTYDLAGRRVRMVDPDAGDWDYSYDPAGNQTSVTDALNETVHTVYDELNRPIQRREDDPVAGPLLAQWDYDTENELGLLDKSFRFTPGGAWEVDVTGYDARNRPTGRSWNVPDSLTAFDDYTVNYDYDQADHPTKVTYPAVGGLALEEVITTYDDLGLPDTMAAGTTSYVNATTYDDRARPSTFGFGPVATPHMGKHWEYDHNQQLALMETAGTGGTLTQSRAIGYDKAGNITERDTTLSGASFKECFKYDPRHRLTTAYTTTSATACDPETNKGTGAHPYNHTYAYTVDGNLDQRTEGATTIDYAYLPSGPSSVRPHAPTDVGADDYTWNANGNQTTRTVGGQLNTLTWDTEHRLAAVDDPDGDSSFTYDADGNRLLRQTPTGNTLYIDGHEITAPTGGGPLTAVRSYKFGGSHIVATRTSTGLDYLVSDNQGSVEQTIPAGNTTAEHTRTFYPYGKLRTGGQPDTDRAWIGQTEDDSTSLQHLNARYYDSSVGVFVGPDPIYDQARPRTINPFNYGMSSPVTESDPSGLDPVCFHTNVDCPPEQKADQVATAYVVGGGDDYQAAYEEALIQAWANELEEVEVSGVTLTPEGVAELQLLAEDLWGQMNGKGLCAEADIGFVAMLTIQGCAVATETDLGFTETIGGGAGSLGAGAGFIMTNADSIEDIKGKGVCFGATIGPGTAAVCGSLDANDELTGKIVVYGGVGLGILPVSGSFTVGYTYAQTIPRADTDMHLEPPMDCACPPGPDPQVAEDLLGIYTN
jgi:RHS repeat-associated protein